MSARSSIIENTTYLHQEDNPVALCEKVEAGSPQFYAIDFPELQTGQFAVCRMEISDGFIFPPDGRSYLDNENGQDGWQVCASFEEARQQAIQNVTADPASECAIYDSSGQLMRVIQNGQPIPLEELLARLPGSSKAWWQVWKH